MNSKNTFLSILVLVFIFFGCTKSTQKDNTDELLLSRISDAPSTVIGIQNQKTGQLLFRISESDLAKNILKGSNLDNFSEKIIRSETKAANSKSPILFVYTSNYRIAQGLEVDEQGYVQSRGIKCISKTQKSVTGCEPNESEPGCSPCPNGDCIKVTNKPVSLQASLVDQ